MGQRKAQLEQQIKKSMKDKNVKEGTPTHTNLINKT